MRILGLLAVKDPAGARTQIGQAFQIYSSTSERQLSDIRGERSDSDGNYIRLR